jgi:Protein of unknown function (DUF3306)
VDRVVDDKEPFLARWSRRKLEANDDAPAGAPQVAESPEPPAAAPAAPLVPTMETPVAGTAQGVTPEFREFFDPQVDEKLRRTALKKLFSDPHFNAMDGLDTYIDDYSKPDPIPEAMLRQLNQAKDLFLFDDEKQASESAGDETSAAAEEAALASPVAAADTATLPEPPPGSASDEAAGAATNADAAPPREGIRNG